MCGLIGIAGPTAGARAHDWVAAGRDAMAHRGPDDAGLWTSPDGRVTLGHQRLSIIDLSPLGHQPMLEGDDLAIVYNGEIYNFLELRTELEAAGEIFRSRSDTEVILKAYRRWGRSFVERLHGMFALALYDARREVVILARDRAGEKPLFYRHSGRELRFASELKGLFADTALERRLDPAALDIYLAMGFVPGDRCILSGFSKLPPAHAMEFDIASGKVEIWRYWNLPAPPVGPFNSDADLVLELEGQLEAAVARQMIADVPLGVLLSGGVDSSLITALAARATSHLKTFTIAFPGHGTLDESGHARLVAEAFGTDHTEIEAEPASVDLLPLLAAQFDEPVIDSSMLPTFLVTRAVRQHCTIALGGDGGDELFAGYGHHSRLAAMQNRLAPIPIALRRSAAGAATSLLPDGRPGRNWIRAMGTDFAHEVPLVALYFDRAARRRLLPDAPYAGVWPDRPTACDGVEIASFLDRVIRCDFRTYLPEDILVKVDRAAMANSLETRAPFLDVRLIEFAYGRIPIAAKGGPATRKQILKDLAARILPPQFDRQRKQGFSIPIDSWLAEGPFRELCRDILLDPGCMFDASAVTGLLKKQDSGYRNGERLFGLVQFELWRRHHSISI